MVDNCRSADISELEDGSHPEFDDSSCQAQGTIPPFNEYLNINAPLQIGGRYVQDFDPTHYHWQYAPYGKGFDGCIKNVYHNSKVCIFNLRVNIKVIKILIFNTTNRIYVYTILYNL